MSIYILTDIHFHTNDSFDAYENDSYDCLDLEKIIGKKSNLTNNHVELICKTDHNVLNYFNYISLKKLFGEKGITLLPGIEINMTNKIHWLIIFSDEELAKINDSGKTYGALLDEEITNLYNYSILNGTMLERKIAQTIIVNVEDIIRKINKLGLSFLAIPHFNKTRGWYNTLKSNKQQLQVIKYLISDNIIVGFESKNQEEELIKSIKQTQRNLEVKLQEFEDGLLTDISQITTRKDHLNMLNELKEMFDDSDTSLIYGTDFHGKCEYSIDNLFYMKSENSFEGLKFALIDPYSRIFSNHRYVKFNKDSNYVLESIKFKDSEDIITFGDGLNSIIGPRGSGKSYLLSMLIGKTQNYANSAIYESLKIDKVCLSEGSCFNTLLPQHFDIISQKNSLNKENDKNIYNLLSEAPYNYSKFEHELELNFEKNQEQTKNIEQYFSNLNTQIKNYCQLGALKNQVPDYSSIDKYNEFYEKESDEILLTTRFESLEQRLIKSLGNYKNKTKLINKLEQTAQDYINDLSELSKFNEVERLGLGSKVKNLLDSIVSFENEVRVPVKTLIDSNTNRINEVLVRVEAINKSLKDSKSNTQLILNDHVTSLRKYITLVVKSLKSTKILEDIITKTENELKDTITYKFKQDEFCYTIKIEKKFYKNNLSIEQFNYIFSKYKNQDNSKTDKLLQLFESNDFGSNFLKMHLNKDNRFSDSSVNIPEIQSEIFLSLNEDNFEKWDSLSPGQRSDILLNIILDTSSKKILIIDQPEDDLDNEMIYKTIVGKLRKLKLSKQIIVVSHNANVVITGDSDTITICQNFDNQFRMTFDTMESKTKYKYTSINTSEIEDTVLNISSLILDGGNEALKRRVKKIGYKNLFFQGSE